MWRRAKRRLAGILLLCAVPAGVSGQGPGSAGGQTLTLTPGARAAALGGAYTGVGGDSDGVFYNPAAAGWVAAGAAFGYENHVEGISMGSVSGGVDVGAGGLRVGAGLVYLSAGEIEEVVPDPRYGGERGRPTGATFGATEAAGRLAVAVPFLDDRARVGVGVGAVSSELAGFRRTAVFADLGAQYRSRGLLVGAALRNLGSSAANASSEGVPLPLEAALGASYRHRFTPAHGALLTADVLVGLEEETVGLAVGAEAGLLPIAGDGAARAVSAVVRAGAILGRGHELGSARVGGGVGIGRLSLDYTAQSLEYFGLVHRFGLRWTR